MLVAGFHTVFATMWSIQDADAPLITQEVYSRLLESDLQDGIVDDGKWRYARALHEAVKVLREKVGDNDFLRWVPFVHYGV